MTNPIDSIRQFYDTHIDPLRQNVQDFVDDAVDVTRDLVDAGAHVVDAAAEGVADVADAVDQAGVLNVAGDVARYNLDLVREIATQGQQLPPQDFMQWLIGPDGPSYADATAQIPGLQDAIGAFIDTSMTNPMIAGGIGRAFGFEYVPGQDFYTTGEDSVQSIGGFHDLYDQVGDLMGMDLTEEVVTFEHEGVEYRIEFWQGSYGAGGAFGGEIGLYTRHTGARGPVGDFLEQTIDGYYSSAGDADQIQMSQTIYNVETGEEYFTNPGYGADDGAHYWNLAIRTDPGVNHEDIGQRGTLELPDADLAQAMFDAMIAEGMDAQLDGTTITYDWP